MKFFFFQKHVIYDTEPHVSADVIERRQSSNPSVLYLYDGNSCTRVLTQLPYEAGKLNFSTFFFLVRVTETSK